MRTRSWSSRRTATATRFVPRSRRRARRSRAIPLWCSRPSPAPRPRRRCSLHRHRSPSSPGRSRAPRVAARSSLRSASSTVGMTTSAGYTRSAGPTPVRVLPDPRSPHRRAHHELEHLVTFRSFVQPLDAHGTSLVSGISREITGPDLPSLFEDVPPEPIVGFQPVPRSLVLRPVVCIREVEAEVAHRPHQCVELEQRSVLLEGPLELRPAGTRCRGGSKRRGPRWARSPQWGRAAAGSAAARRRADRSAGAHQPAA